MAALVEYTKSYLKNCNYQNHVYFPRLLWGRVHGLNVALTIPGGIVLAAVLVPLLHPLKAEGPANAPVGFEENAEDRIKDLQVRITIARDGAVWISQNFRIARRTGLIKRGPILNYLTAFQGPGGLILDNEWQVLRVLKDGEPEPYHFEKGDGFVTLYVGSPDLELETRDYTYRIEYRTGADWRKVGGEFSAVFDAAGPLPSLPIDSAEVEVVLPEGVTISKFSPAVSGFENPDESQGPGFTLDSGANIVTLTTNRALATKRGLFLNLVWPSGTFGTQSHWMKVMRQHPGIPLSAFSGVSLLWALVTILVRASRRGESELR